MASSRKSAGARRSAGRPASRAASAAAKAAPKAAPKASAAKSAAKKSAAKPATKPAPKATAAKKAAPGPKPARPAARGGRGRARSEASKAAAVKVAARGKKAAAAKTRAVAGPRAGGKAPAAPKKRAGAKAAAGAFSRPPRRGAPKRVGPEPPEAPHAVPGLSEEDQIRAAKFLPREMPKRVFEEERFIFPETYGVNRIRLLVRDPEWIFAYWDVSPAAMKDFAKRIGERALALSRLTLRVVDPVSGGSTDILLPPGARWWYVRTDASRRTYRAELGVTLPSGEFRRLAESNTVVTPRVGPSPDRARRRMSYPDARELPLSEAVAASEAAKKAGLAREPWAPGAVAGAETPASVAGRAGQGGASDTFRPGGASDSFPGASDTFRR
jgi:hypothetical protein